MRVLVPRPDAVNDGDRFGLAAVAQHHLARGGAGGVDQAFHFEGRVDIGELAVAVVWNPAGVEGLESGGQNHRPHFDLLRAGFGPEVDGVAVAAGGDTGGLALARFELDAGFGVDDRHLRDGLRERDVNRAALAQSHVEFIRHFCLFVYAGVDALQAAGAEVLIHIPRVSQHRDFVVAHVAVHVGHLGAGPQRDVRMAADGGHLRGEDAGGAIQGRERLVKPGHVAAYGGFAFHQIDVLAGIGQGQGRVNARDAATEDQDFRVNRHSTALQRLVERNPQHRGAHQVLGFTGSLRPVGVHPGGLFPNVHHMEIERVEPAHF